MVQPSPAGHSPRRALQLLWVMGECRGRRAPWLQAILELATREGGRGGVPRLVDEGTQGRFLWPGLPEGVRRPSSQRSSFSFFHFCYVCIYSNI